MGDKTGFCRSSHIYEPRLVFISISTQNQQKKGAALFKMAGVKKCEIKGAAKK